MVLLFRPIRHILQSIIAKGGDEVRLLKCYGEECLKSKNKFPKEELYEHKGKNYCKKCYEKKKEYDKDYDHLCKYICEIFNCDYVDPYIKSQIKQFNKTGFTLKGIRSTLWYIVNVLKIKLKREYGIAIVKYQYYSAKKYAEEKNNQKTQVKKKEEIEVITRYVNIDRFRANKPKKKFSLEDINIEGE